jgi:hypothetical protein
MNNYDYSWGADTPNAPWNQSGPEPKEVDVTVSITLSKQFTIEVNDYKEYTDQDEDGIYTTIDFSDCDLKEAVKRQIYLPHEAHEHINVITVKNNLKDWCVNYFEVILD